MPESLIRNDIPAPKAITKTKRLNDCHKSMRPGDSVLTDAKTAGCVRVFGVYKGWKMTQRKEGESVRVWRLEDQ